MMQFVLCNQCGERMNLQVNADHVTAGCICGMRVAAQYIFSWRQVPALLRAHATKAFGAHGKWRILPPVALEYAIRRRESKARADAGTSTSTSTCPRTRQAISQTFKGE